MTAVSYLVQVVLSAAAVLIGMYVGDKDPVWYVAIPLVVAATTAVNLASAVAILEDRRSR